MGNVLSAQKISAALDRAKNICIIEEVIEIAGNRLVVRNLRPADYENINKATEGATHEAELLYAWQKAHICYALVEVNGIDLRGVDFVEVEEADKDGQRKTVKLEVPTYLRDHLVSTWSKEAVYTVFRKIGDAVARAESASSENIKFLVPEEGPEEKYRRLVSEMRDIEDEVPPALVDKILDEHGFMKKSTAAEIKAAMEKDSQAGWEEVQRQKREAETAASPLLIELCESTTVSPLNPRSSIRCDLGKGHTGSHAASNLTWQDPQKSEIEYTRPDGSHPSSDRRITPTGTPESFEKRVPLSQMIVDMPQPPAVQPATVPATRKRAEEIAALEEEVEGSRMIEQHQIPGAAELPEHIPMLTKKQERINPQETARAIDRPPSVGLNPKFRPMR